MTIEIYKNSNNVDLTRGNISIGLSRGDYTCEIIKDDSNEVKIEKSNNEVFLERNDNSLCDIVEVNQDREIDLQRANLDIEVIKTDVNTELNKIEHSVEIPTCEKEFLLQLQPSIYPSSTVNRTMSAHCASSDGVGDCVYLYGPKITDDWYQVRKADITNSDKMPSFGIIVEKYTPTTCKVQWFGFVENIYSTLVLGKPHFVGYDSKPTWPNPARSAAAHILQKIGIAFDSDTLLLVPDLRIFKRFVH